MVNLKVTLGTVNYTDWLHVTASKISAPGVIVWEDWIDVPVTNYNFIIPNLDPENYYVRYYDAPTDSSLGTLVAELIVNALTGDTLYERRFYTVGGPGDYDPADGDTHIIDPYLIGKTVTGIFKEGFRPLDPADEWTFDDVTGDIEVLYNGTTMSLEERFAVDIKYNTGTSSGGGGGLYVGTLNITAATHTLLGADADKRIRLSGSAATQVITLCALSAISADRGFYFDNSGVGVAKQPKIVTTGADKILFNGFDTGSNEFDEFWLSKGEHFLIRKYDDDYWEIITDYKGTNVGEKVTVGYKSHPGILTENGQLVDGDEYPRLWWWINNVLPVTHRYVSNTYDVTDPAFPWGFAEFQIRRGQFILHPTLKKFRMPNTVGMSERALANFDTYGGDVANRFIDYPGGYQADMLIEHTHNVFFEEYATGLTANPGYDGGNNNYAVDQNKATSSTGGVEQRVKNIGVIYGRRI